MSSSTHCSPTTASVLASPLLPRCFSILLVARQYLIYYKSSESFLRKTASCSCPLVGQFSGPGRAIGPQTVTLEMKCLLTQILAFRFILTTFSQVKVIGQSSKLRDKFGHFFRLKVELKLEKNHWRLRAGCDSRPEMKNTSILEAINK